MDLKQLRRMVDELETFPSLESAEQLQAELREAAERWRGKPELKHVDDLSARVTVVLLGLRDEETIPREMERAEEKVADGVFSEALDSLENVLRAAPDSRKAIKLLRMCTEQDENTRERVIGILDGLPAPRGRAALELLHQLRPFAGTPGPEDEPAGLGGPSERRRGPEPEPATPREATVDDVRGLMGEADELFYQGFYVEAAKIYGQVLDLVPDHPRASERLSEAEENILTGYVPDVRVPPDAGRLFGEAQSLSRRGHYDEALKKIDDAIEICQKAGIARWARAERFRNEVFAAQQAEAEYQDGKRLLESGEFAEAKDAFRRADATSPSPRFKEAAQRIERIERDVQTVMAALGVRGRPEQQADRLTEAQDMLDSLDAELPSNPALRDLRRRLELKAPEFADALIERAKKSHREVRNRQYEDLETALSAVGDAIALLSKVKRLMPDNARVEEQLDIARQDQEGLKKLASRLDTALGLPLEDGLLGSHAHLGQIEELIRPVRQAYPLDPELRRVEASLRRPRCLRRVLYGAMPVAALLILIALAYTIPRLGSVLPPIVPPASPTPTEVIAPSPTTTATPSPTPPAPPTPTPEPHYGYTKTDVTLEANPYWEAPDVKWLTKGTRLEIIVGGDENVRDDLERLWIKVRIAYGDGLLLGWVLASAVQEEQPH